MKPILGSWLDILHHSSRDGVYWNRKTLAYSTSDWRRLIQHLAEDFRLEYLILTNVVAYHGLYLYPSRRKRSDGSAVPRFLLNACEDPVKAILEAAAEFRLKVFVGTGFYPKTDGLIPSGQLADHSLQWIMALAEELLERYGCISSFHGFYTAIEPGFQTTGLFRPDEVEWVGGLTGTLRKLSPERKILISPHHCWQIAKADADLNMLTGQIRDMAVDFFVPQDGVGFDVPHSPRPAALAHEAFRRLKGVCAEASCKLWANVEVFRFENQIYFQPLLPASWQRIEDQIRGVSPHVEKIFCYQIPGLMTSQALFPRLGEPESQELYEAYQHYLQSLAK